MIRRWSRINNFNFFLNSASLVMFRFSAVKLLKALNYKKFAINYSKFRRSKLSRWKRRGNWVIYSQILKSWIYDYFFNKKLTKSYYMHNIFLNSFFVYNYYYIKKKNPLNLTRNVFFNSQSISKCFYFYFYNKYWYKTTISMLNSTHNTNFLLFYVPDYKSLTVVNDNNFLITLLQMENYLFSPTLLNFFKNIQNLYVFNFFYCIILQQSIDMYKIFIFFFLNIILLNVKLPCLLNYLN
jgi:hypothetical protein